jgi:D-amino-acid oxidase
VTGLSAALQIQADGHDVTIVARDFIGALDIVDPRALINFTSPWGGAHSRLVPPRNPREEKEHAMLIRTSSHMRSIHSKNPEAGITFMKGIEYLEKPGAAYKALTEARAKELGMEEFRLLKPEELPDKVTWGCEYNTWCVNPEVYLPFLLRRFVFLGGKVVRREVRDPAEVFEIGELGSVEVVVNCSGNGFNDEKVIITRGQIIYASLIQAEIFADQNLAGQTCLVANECPATVTRQNSDGSWTFSVPRGFEGGTVIGGTKEPNNWDPNPSPEVRASLLRSFAATYPQILAKDGQFHVIQDIVGRRPTRTGGIRLETEQLEKGKSVIHAYGLGGRGYELSWGVAEGVVELLSEHLHSGPQESQTASRSSKL